jgi:aspartyl-tRNA(Asn)/glutamyl-tRNA(Gln) amidotransferase subunit A
MIPIDAATDSFTDTALCATASVQARMIRDGQLTATDLVAGYLARIAAYDSGIGAYLHVASEQAMRAAELVDQKRAAGRPLGPLAGVCIAIKDNIVTADMPTTAGSLMLAGWRSPYNAAVIERLLRADAVILGKTNCDEFGMGSSTENSAFQVTRNPWGSSRIPGGSSGGSAAAVAADLCSASLGTDTGGSIRQPAAMCGTVGFKPTYGRVSRWGMIAYASSLDQIGPLTKSVQDAALITQVIAGVDHRDATSIDLEVPDFQQALPLGVAGLTIGIPREYFPQNGVDAEIRTAIDASIAALRSAGATVVDVSLPHTALALPAYYVIAPAEASSNLARYDGVRFGRRAVLPPQATLADMLELSRAEGFGTEVKRRIMLGTFALRAGYYDEYEKKAQQVRALIKRDFDQAFASVDVILTPTSPTTAFALGARSTPMEMYLADVFTLSCNLAGLPGMSVPCGLSSDGLPIGVQVLAPALDEISLLRVAVAIEKSRGLGDRRPMLTTSSVGAVP